MPSLRSTSQPVSSDEGAMGGLASCGLRAHHDLEARDFGRGATQGRGGLDGGVGVPFADRHMRWLEGPYAPPRMAMGLEVGRRLLLCLSG